MAKIKIAISQTLSSVQEIEVPDDMPLDNYYIESLAKEQIVLPSDCLEYEGYNMWVIDDFCITNEELV